MKLENVLIQNTADSYSLVNIIIQNGIIDTIESITENFTDFSDERVRYYITPGFVNSHLHPNQLTDRRLLDGLNIEDLLSKMHTDYKKTYHDRYIQALFVLIDSIKCGATSNYAVASNPIPVINAFNDLGCRGAITCFFNDQWEGKGIAPKIDDLKKIEREFREYSKFRSELLSIHIGSASVESASNRLLLLLEQLADLFATKVNIHVAEGISSVENCERNRGSTPIKLLSNLNVINEKWNLIHAVNINDSEVDIIVENGAKVIHCPVSNAKTGVGITPLHKLLQKNACVSLGTDACSNNNTNNILNEAYFCSLIHSAINHNAAEITVETIIKMLTTNAYQAMGINQIGIIAKEKKADLLLWDLHSPSFNPLYYKNFNSTLIYNAPDIKPHTVIINGEVFVEAYEFKKVDERDIIKAITDLSKEISCFIF